MSKVQRSYDHLIIGGGIFGCYAALYLASKGSKVGLIEKENALFKKASIVNQARLHSGYHYPRSVATANMSDDNKARFTREHKDFIYFKFDKYYAIDRFGSFTDARQFERFCQYIDIPCVEDRDNPLFNYNRLEAVFKTEEFTFDPFLLKGFYQRKVMESPNIDLLLNSQIVGAEAPSKDHWRIELIQAENPVRIKSPTVINATYAGTNSILRIFGLQELKLMHEISEIGLIHSRALKNVGLTVMDGPFGSIMPYGRSGLLSISSVAYTHHKVSYANVPEFDCMQSNQDCKPTFLSDCNACSAQPPTNIEKMEAQMRKYFQKEVDWTYFKSLFTIKSKLQASFIDDGRPTEIRKYSEGPDFYGLFAGKINSIYEIEKIF